MAKENPENTAPVEANNAEAPKTVPVEQYDNLVRQYQNLIAEANARLSALENDKKVLQDTLNVQNKLVEKLLKADETK